jgi:uncharacterized membrane protein (UPF0127 family)
MTVVPKALGWSLCGVLLVVAAGCASSDDDPGTADDAIVTSPSEPPPAATTTETSAETSPGPTTTDPTGTAVTATVTATSTNPIDEPSSAGTPAGFASVAATITLASGEVCELCLWVADDPALRSRGLMDVTDLGSADGMLFSYEMPTSTAFWMKNTPLPLSIAFFDGEGAYLDSFDMEPCTAEPCEHYPTPPDFLDAIEFPQGTVDELGVGAGSMLVVTDLPCTP